MTIRRPPGDDRPYYWRAVAYDHFNFFGWDWIDPPVTTPVAAGKDILASTLDAPPDTGGRDVIFSVTPESYRQAYAVSPLVTDQDRPRLTTAQSRQGRVLRSRSRSRRTSRTS